MLWKIHPDTKLKNKGQDENHNLFTFSYHHIQLYTIITYSLDADITIDIGKSINYNILWNV